MECFLSYSLTLKKQKPSKQNENKSQVFYHLMKAVRRSLLSHMALSSLFT